MRGPWSSPCGWRGKEDGCEYPMSICEVVERIKDKDGAVVVEILDCGHRLMAKANNLKPMMLRRRCKVCSAAPKLDKKTSVDDSIPF